MQLQLEFFSFLAMKMSANPWRDGQVVTQTQYLDLELSSKANLNISHLDMFGESAF